MSVNHALCLAAVLTLSGSVHAQGCARDSQGGMDATGNECSAAVETTYDVDPSVWSHISARMHKPVRPGAQTEANAVPASPTNATVHPLAAAPAVENQAQPAATNSPHY